VDSSFCSIPAPQQMAAGCRLSITISLVDVVIYWMPDFYYSTSASPRRGIGSHLYGMTRNRISLGWLLGDFSGLGRYNSQTPCRILTLSQVLIA
jgi:hypothetical protein